MDWWIWAVLVGAACAVLLVMLLVKRGRKAKTTSGGLAEDELAKEYGELVRQQVGTYDPQLARSPVSAKVHYRKKVKDRSTDTVPKRRNPTGGNSIEQVAGISSQVMSWRELYEDRDAAGLAACAEAAGGSTSRSLWLIAAALSWKSGDELTAYDYAKNAQGGPLDEYAFPGAAQGMRLDVHLEDTKATVTLVEATDVLGFLVSRLDGAQSWPAQSRAGKVVRLWTALLSEEEIAEECWDFEPGKGNLGALAGLLQARCHVRAGRFEQARKASLEGLSCHGGNDAVNQELVELAGD